MTISIEKCSPDEIPQIHSGQRHGKYAPILKAIRALEIGECIKIKRKELPFSVPKAQAALLQSFRKKRGIKIRTAANFDHLFILRLE